MTRNASGSLTLQALEDKECVYIMRDDVTVSNAFATPSVMATTSGDVMSDVFSSSCDVGRNSICGVGNGLTLKLRVLSHVYNKAYFSKREFVLLTHSKPEFKSEFKSCIPFIPNKRT